MIESTLRSFTKALSKAFASEQTAAKRGLLQSFDPRARIVSILVLVIAVVLTLSLLPLSALFLLAVFVSFGSRVPFGTLIKRVWLIVFGFTGLIALPAIFITPGDVVAQAGRLAITAQGLRTACLLILRVETAVTLTTALVLSTHWVQILRGLRALWVPAEVVTMLAMTHRYIFLLIETAGQMFESRQSRMVGAMSGADQRRMAIRTAGVLLGKSADLSYDVYLAMQSRGFTGDIRLLDSSRMKLRDLASIVLAIVIAFLAVWFGR
ncbi:MAG: cobalt ECF transporter T component CbiQ [Terriglobia bacterium]|jgi:cobalt ECF transporter T component CbiQ|nr:cobalt ECF transporter T component CbiQ [Terriglobia bacterium]